MNREGYDGMREKTLQAILGCLLHDVGKLVYRSGSAEGTNHGVLGQAFLKECFPQPDVLDCVRFHHKADLLHADLPNESPAYVAYIANSIVEGKVRGSSKREEEEQDYIHAPLRSVFNLLHGNTLDYSYGTAYYDDERIPFPDNGGKNEISSGQYLQILHEVREHLKNVQPAETYINVLLSALERCLSFVPSSVGNKDASDISMFDHLKMTAAVGACVSEYLMANNRPGFRDEIWGREEAFCQEQAFLMFSADYSGIQKFIYNISSKGALKTLRSRSFMLELLMEHLCDELLTECGLSRTNLIYTGGGHCYILLPNTQEVRNKVDAISARFNQWLRQNFGIRLYLSAAYTECSANDLMNIPEGDHPYKNIFMRLSHALADNKLHRYTADEILEMNQQPLLSGERECKTCGAMDRLLPDEDICRWCSVFRNISGLLRNEELLIMVTPRPIADLPYIELPRSEGEAYLHLTNEDRVREELSKGTDILRIYAKNKVYPDLERSTTLFMGDYCHNSLLEELLDDSEGIKQIGYFRADVDNLGSTFTSGFERKTDDPAERYRYVSLTRTAAFSRRMTMFFKYYINSILRGNPQVGRFRLRGKPEDERGRKVIIIYSGGDDIFMAGQWANVIEAAADIYRAFRRYTAGTLTLSGGICIHALKYPIHKAANEAGELEDAAKKLDGKCGITLFEADDSLTFKWDDFLNRVIGEKLHQIQEFFDFYANEQGCGSAFLYRLLTFLRSQYLTGDKINIARYAYLLARMRPSGSASARYRSAYREFSTHMYRWIMDNRDLKELICAIYIYIYLTRAKYDALQEAKN